MSEAMHEARFREPRRIYPHSTVCKLIQNSIGVEVSLRMRLRRFRRAAQEDQTCSKQIHLHALHRFWHWCWLAGTVAGCASKQEQALDQAKAQAAKTGQAQQVISVDKNGNTTTTVVQPPANGQNQNSEAIATTVTPPTAGVATPAASGPMVSVAPPPPPVEVNIVAGTPLTIRIDQWISVKHSRAGDTFTGEIVDPVLANDNSALIPKGALVDGVVDVSHRRDTSEADRFWSCG